MKSMRIVHVALLAMLASAPALAIRLPGKSAADRAAVEPLRTADLAGALDGRDAGPAWREAARELPDRCRSGALASGNACDDDVRCAWLAARGAALEAAASRAGLADAAATAHRVAQRLAAGRCADDERWKADARSAALDDARLHLVLLLQQGGDVGPVLEAEDQRRVDALVAVAGRGVSGVDPEALFAAREALYRAHQRRAWLDQQPVLVRLRALLPAVHGAAIPAACGPELLRPDLLEDQWRGFLVREVTPAALQCIGSRVSAALAARGATAEAANAAALARSLAANALGDAGGRRFGADPEVLRQLAELTEALRAAAAPSVATSGARPAVPRPAPAAAGFAAPRAPSATPPAPRVPAAVTAPAPGVPDPALVRLARQVAELAPSAEGLESAARRATTPEEQAQIVSLLLVQLHRATCAPLADADPDDLDAARRVVAAHRVRPREDACRPGEGRAALFDLLNAAPGLTRLGAAAHIRAASRSLALNQPGEARRRLELVAPSLRGTTWSIVAAWAARQAHDPVEAARILAGINSETLDRLRSSGDEEVARLVTHAYSSQ